MATPSLDLDIVADPLFGENTYIVRCSGRNDCLVVDPGLDPESVITTIVGKSLTPAAILNTHGHIDHIAGNSSLKQRWPEAPLVIGAGDAFKLTDANANLSGQYGMPVTSPPADICVSEPETYIAGGFELEVFDTPGHSPGHVVFIWKNTSPWVVFGGDVLFQGSVGRTDFPDGDFDQLRRAIHEKLFVLPNDTIVLPGHGPQTTIEAEKRSNPYVGMGPNTGR